MVESIKQYDADKNPVGSERTGLGAKVSVMQPYSIGMAAANLKVGQTQLSVWAIEDRSHVDGEVTDNLSDFTTSGVDGQGEHYSQTVQASNVIVAEWLSRNSWLKLPGLVRRGEKVQIWRVGDSQEYYWELLGTSNHLRRQDIMLLVVSNTTDETTKELTSQNSVFFEINTVDKHIVLSTPNNDGEACAYQLQLNMKDGNFALSDSVGNGLALDSIEHIWHMVNADNTRVLLDKTQLHLEANDLVKIKTKVLDIETETTNMKGNNFSGQYTNTTWEGSQLSQSFDQGTTKMNGAMTYTGGGSVNYQIDIKHNGIDIGSQHRHKRVQSGNGESGEVAG